ncbi:protein-L-isoaspartate O-methyltransferase family protein [Parasulfitobacter algicola]|uniref:Protein-L-isoaspartate O-methyltransferase n=1 Tax=Parasulfitobacter algicola TaxID=2614809 RepID=A0ABX2IV24_9RHOB|nr:protein-L-isoaspartate O-methyltransferase [Sulfitobacter algicola]NSX56165.1 protein-L-isoaspartate O-methyltransferase [Sulfitobacter algicola]
MSDFAARRTMMVDTQVRPSDVTKFPIINAMLSVPREEYVPDAQREAAYVGENMHIGNGRMMLEPRTLAKLLDALAIQNDELVLDIGCGLGYSSAVIAHIAEAVVAIEDDEIMADAAQSNLSEQNIDNAAVVFDPLSNGAAKHGPYDVIVVQGGVETVPVPILDQLKEGGRIACIFMQGALGQAKIGYKTDDGISWRFIFNATAPILSGFQNTKAFQL